MLDSRGGLRAQAQAERTSVDPLIGLAPCVGLSGRSERRAADRASRQAQAEKASAELLSPSPGLQTPQVRSGCGQVPQQRNPLGSVSRSRLLWGSAALAARSVSQPAVGAVRWLLAQVALAVRVSTSLRGLRWLSLAPATSVAQAPHQATASQFACLH